MWSVTTRPPGFEYVAIPLNLTQTLSSWEYKVPQKRLHTNFVNVAAFISTNYENKFLENKT